MLNYLPFAVLKDLYLTFVTLASHVHLLKMNYMFQRIEYLTSPAILVAPTKPTAMVLGTSSLTLAWQLGRMTDRLEWILCSSRLFFPSFSALFQNGRKSYWCRTSRVTTWYTSHPCRVSTKNLNPVTLSATNWHWILLFPHPVSDLLLFSVVLNVLLRFSTAVKVCGLFIRWNQFMVEPRYFLL